MHWIMSTSAKEIHLIPRASDDYVEEETVVEGNRFTSKHVAHGAWPNILARSPASGSDISPQQVPRARLGAPDNTVRFAPALQEP